MVSPCSRPTTSMRAVWLSRWPAAVASNLTFALAGAADLTCHAEWRDGAAPGRSEPAAIRSAGCLGWQTPAHAMPHWAVLMKSPAGDATLTLHVAGWHNVKNALAATACAVAAGCPLDAIMPAGSSGFEPVKGRSQLKSLAATASARSRWSTTPTTPTPILSAPPSTCSPSLPGSGLVDPGRHGRSRRRRARQFHREVGDYAATLGVHRCAVDRGHLVRGHAAEAFNETLMRGSLTGTFNQSRGVRHFAQHGRTAGRRCIAGRRAGGAFRRREGLALHEDGAVWSRC